MIDGLSGQKSEQCGEESLRAGGVHIVPGGHRQKWRVGDPGGKCYELVLQEVAVGATSDHQRARGDVAKVVPPPGVGTLGCLMIASTTRQSKGTVLSDCGGTSRGGIARSRPLRLPRVVSVRSRAEATAAPSLLRYRHGPRTRTSVGH